MLVIKHLVFKKIIAEVHLVNITGSIISFHTILLSNTVSSDYFVLIYSRFRKLEKINSIKNIMGE
jgi:hypothetical protein